MADDPLKKSFEQKYGKGASTPFGSGIAASKEDVLQAEKEELADLEKKFAALSNDVDNAVKKAFQNRIDNLRDAISKGEKAPKSSIAQKVEGEQEQRRQQNKFKQSARAATAANIASNIAQTPQKVAKQAKSSSEKLADLALKEAQRAEQQRRNPSLPPISKDTATEIVLASVAATFLLLAGAGVKFSELWQLAFSSKGSGPGDFVGAGPGGIPDDSWDIPNPFHEVA